ncbi:hypothetical protein [Microcella alkaliphila]|uniref:Integral membrane protein n=1 Tax=Microcella alkaliphila TaxID=279828 RepID=A0A0U5BP82_9MICO|nr:hypothetical protein [Microcella alkaliphila]BAU32070.1 uncharacterized protein MalAC0309_1213 [Microcella alkaliphila]
MSAIAAVAFTAVMVALAVFQLALIAGAPLGHFAWGGQDRVLPAGKRVGSVVSIVLYALFAVVVLQRADFIELLPGVVVDVGIWVVVAYSALGIVMNGISRSRPERYTMAPVCVVLTVLSLVVALG